MTYRRLDVLLTRLPMESAFHTEIRDLMTDEELAAAAEQNTSHGAWSKQDMLLAAVFDSINTLTHVQIARAGAKADPPEPLSRPGVTSKKKQAVSPQAQEYLLRIRQLHAEQAGGEPS